jgi:hypothetical protein
LTFSCLLTPSTFMLVANKLRKLVFILVYSDIYSRMFTICLFNNSQRI